MIDLSTGINPHSYPLPRLPPAVFARLPEPAALERLAAIAARAYGTAAAPGAAAPRAAAHGVAARVVAAHVVAAPGTQILLPLVFALVPAGRAAVLSPTYAEHARVARLVGHQTTEVAAVDALEAADLAIVVNPNNPDGRIVGKDALLELAAQKQRRGGLLVVDEAFAEVGPAGLSLAPEVGRGGIVVLRSFGKFHGLAGLRLGFALATTELAARLRATLGPWPVAGPALLAGEAALADGAWAAAMRDRLARDAARLDRLLIDAGLAVAGGTSLFRLVHAPAAAALADHLGHAGIMVRRFAERPHWLRFGLPADEAAWERLAAALAVFAGAPRAGSPAVSADGGVRDRSAGPATG